MATSTKSLISTLKALHAALSALIERLKRIDALLAEALEATLITKTIVDLLTDVHALLEAAHAALMVLAEVPYVNVVAKPLKELVGKIKGKVRAFKEQVERLEGAIAPLRDQAQSAREAMMALLTPLAKLDGFVAQELAHLERAEAAVSGLPEGRYRRAQEAHLEGVAAKIAAALGPHQAELARARAAVDALEPQLASMSERSQGLIGCSKRLTDLLGDVGDVAEDARSLDEALNQKIHFGGRQVSIKSALESAGSAPKELMKPVTQALAGPLRELQRGMGMGLPDPIQVVAAFQAIQRHLDAVLGGMKASHPRLHDLADRSGLARAFTAIAP